MVGLVNLHGAVKVRHLNFWLVADTASSGRGIDGREQVMWSENRYWAASLTVPPLERDAAMRAASIGDELCGRAGVLRVTFCNSGTLGGGGDLDAFYTRLGVTYADRARGFLTFSDGEHFTDDTGHALPVLSDPVVRDAVAAGRRVVLDGAVGRNLAVGAFFSANDFLYRVSRNDDGRVTFNPPLREALPAGYVVRAIWPRVRLRLRDDAGWRVFQDYGRISQEMTVDLEEAAGR